MDCENVSLISSLDETKEDDDLFQKFLELPQHGEEELEDDSFVLSLMTSEPDEPGPSKRLRRRQKCKIFAVSYVPLVGTVSQSMGLALGKVIQINDLPQCQKLPGLSAGQGKICQLYQDHMTAVANGAHQALLECRHQFQHRRWNCSILDELNVLVQ
ncbi:hypothetical protein FQA39_LY15979 [Lamprigera yunnana]|nr:hypothetical protein FQA39_LY15979 [Lamprigera yunnana]